MRVRGLQTLVDRKFPGAWHANTNQTGFVLTRIDSVELIDTLDLALLAALLVDFRIYATIGQRTQYLEDGFTFELWLMPMDVKARTPRKPDRRQAARRVSDKAARRLKRK